jgi:hypothetical protein
MNFCSIQGVTVPYENLSDGFFLFGWDGCLHVGVTVGKTLVDLGEPSDLKPDLSRALNKRILELMSDGSIKRLRHESVWSKEAK